MIINNNYNNYYYYIIIVYEYLNEIKLGTRFVYITFLYL